MAIVGKYIAAGDLRDSITLQSRSEAVDALGGITESWSTTISTRAKVEPIRGEERATMAQANAAADYRFWIRYRSGVTPQLRLVWDSREFDIVSALPLGNERRYIEILAKERFV